MIDLVSTLLAERELADPVELAGGARFALSHNAGVAFGGLSGAPPALVVGLVVVCLTGLVSAMSRGLLAGGAVVVGLILGGAIANLIDRVEGGGVTDFVDLGTWPSFNVADAALTAGVVLMLCRGFREPATPAAGALGHTGASGTPAA